MSKPAHELAAESLHAAQQHAREAGSAAAKHVFRVLHGYYGTLFLSKFSTGELNENGDDMGTLSARAVWAYAMRPFDAETVKAALRQCQADHPEFPPSLPQFVALCFANRPRSVYKPAIEAIEMSGELRSRYAAKAREINARHDAIALQSRVGRVDFPPGLDGLKQAIAAAIAAAGGDEAAALANLDRMLTTRTAS